jgi:hypothetical protein
VLDNKDGEDLPAHASMAVDWIDKQKGEFVKQVTGRQRLRGILVGTAGVVLGPSSIRKQASAVWVGTPARGVLVLVLVLNVIALVCDSPSEKLVMAARRARHSR